MKKALFLGLCLGGIGVVSLLAFPSFVKEKEETRDLPEVKIQKDLTPLDRSNKIRVTSYADMLDQVTPAVVSVSTARMVRYQQQPNTMEDFLRHMYGLPRQERRQEQRPESELVPQGIGTGFIVGENGYILTNHHVIAGQDGNNADQVIVQLADTREFEAEIVGGDPQTDVAVLKIDAEDLPVLTMADSEQLRVGDIVFAVGNPLNVGMTVTQGIISAMGKTDLGILGWGGFENFIQTDASINMGNSGGPLVDANGRVIGINSAIVSRTGGSIGIGFAIPMDLAYSVMKSLVNDGEVRRGFLGVELQELNTKLAQIYGLQGRKGALLGDVKQGYPADLAGVHSGDVVISVDGESVESVSDFRYKIASKTPGTRVELGIVRMLNWDRGIAEEMSISVVLGDREKGLVGEIGGENLQLLEGITLKSIDLELREEYEIPDKVDGIVVTGVESGSPYFSELKEGTVIVKVNGEKILKPNELSEHVKLGEDNVFRIYANGRHAYVPILVEE